MLEVKFAVYHKAAKVCPHSFPQQYILAEESLTKASLQAQNHMVDT